MQPWMELAKMYESIKDYDFLRSIFSSQVSAVDMTRDALAYEARNDYESALSLYRKVCLFTFLGFKYYIHVNGENT